MPVRGSRTQSTPQPTPLHRRPAAIAWVFLGGLVGTGVRYALEEVLPPQSGHWPVATFTVNLVGAFVLGLLLEGLARTGDDDGWRRRLRLLAGTGFCGSFTTYSSFALETSLLARDGATSMAMGYALGTVVAGLVCVWLGIVIAASVLRTRDGEVR
ncbi:CrcB family protein [Gordonia sinesedis]